MNIFNDFKKKLTEIILFLAEKHKVQISQQQLSAFTVEPCKNSDHGDVATNIAMVCCKSFKTNPRQLAGIIIEKVKEDQSVEKVEIAGAGFINVVFKNSLWHQFLLSVLQQKEYKLPDLSDNKKINIEYASPNPTGPMHVGHTRGAIYGDVLANLLEKTGFDVTREYYINDAGGQIATLIKSVYLRYLESLGEKIIIGEGLYPGEYLKPIAKKLKDKYSDSLKQMDEQEIYDQIRDFVIEEMMKIIKTDLKLLNIKHDNFFSEKQQLHDSGKIEQIVKELEQKGLIYKGSIEAPKGKKGKNYRPQEQLLFKSTDFGDDSDRVVQTADGRYTYFAADIAYCLNKFQRGAEKIILSVGFDHAGYVKRLNAALKAVTNDKAELKVILCQMVKFVKGGEPLKMSKRAGNFVTAADLVKQVGADVMRFIMLTRKNDAPFDFDVNNVVEQSKDNPIFYVQYAHARCCSILRNLKEQIPDLPDLQNIVNQTPALEDLSVLQSGDDIELIKKLAAYPRIIEMAVSNFEPHRIAFYLTELAALFHSFWNKGIQDSNLRFIISDNVPLTKARIYLVIAISKIIASALSIFNIEPVQQMR